MKMIKVDYLVAERRKYNVVEQIGKQYCVVECPFCGHKNLVYYRNFWKGARCKNTRCRALIYRPTQEAIRDLVPSKGSGK